MQRGAHIVLVFGLVFWLAWLIGTKSHDTATRKSTPLVWQTSSTSLPMDAESSSSGALSTKALSMKTRQQTSVETLPFGTEAAPQRPHYILNPDNARQASGMRNGANILPEVAQLARQLNDPDKPPDNDLEILQKLLEIYRKGNYGANPEGGLNYDITKELRGDNPSRFAVLPEDLPSLGSDGELVDRWGTPYWFHPISSRVMEVRSAGPDGKLWTADDIVISSGSAQ